MRGRLVALLVLAAAVGPPASAGPGAPDLEGPDVPTVGTPVVVQVFDDERFTCTETSRTRTIAVPEGTWDRVVLEITITPDGDPWDRVFGVAIGGVEVLRGTTPRTEMTLRKDVTRYARLLPPGGTADVSLLLGSYVGSLLGSVHLELYAAEPTAAVVRAPVDPVAAVTWGSLNGTLTTVGATVALPAQQPARAQVQLTISGHGAEEYGNSAQPRRFRVLVDGTEVALFVSMPYTYAFLGLGGPDANTPCVGPGTSAAGDALHPVMWWTAQRALDAAGVHPGVGEIPPFVAPVDEAQLGLLTGARRIEVVQIGGASRWITSLALLLEP